MLFSLILFSIVCTVECEVLSESLVIRLKELEAVIREQRDVIQDLTVMISVSGEKNIIEECQANLTSMKHRLPSRGPARVFTYR